MTIEEHIFERKSFKYSRAVFKRHLKKPGNSERENSIYKRLYDHDNMVYKAHCVYINNWMVITTEALNDTKIQLEKVKNKITIRDDIKQKKIKQLTIDIKFLEAELKKLD